MFDKDELGLKKLEKDLNKSLSIDFDLNLGHKKGTKKKKFPQPKPKYTNQPKQISKQDIQNAKKFVKETGSAFGNLVNAIKNRKIRKLEKETLKNIKKAEDMAHELKTLQNNNEALTDIARYEKELEKERKEYRERKGQMQEPTNKEIVHSEPCKEYQLLNIHNDCICGADEK